ncbi:MAG: dienelactone hydrolase family protein [Chromatiales bacterium]|nr:MAG: dienelactone hydrolase family protein [Chromatiales bacterium]
MAAAHANDKPVPTPVATAAPDRAVSAGPVQYGAIDGQPLTGYLAAPKDLADDAPAIIVIHEWWGLNDNIRSVTERLAGEGYRALAVDLYRGELAEDPKTAMKLSRGLQQQAEQANDNLRQAYAYLEAQSAPRIGVIGWCLGGRWSLRTALLLPDRVDAAVIYYGSLVTDRDQLATLQMPILGNFGEADPIIPLDDIATFEQTLRELGKDVDVKIYPGAQHAFSNPSGTAYNPEAAQDAWGRTTGFFARHLQAQ